MPEIRSRHYKKSRAKKYFRFSLKKLLHMGTLVIVGEYMLLNVINHSLSHEQPAFIYRNLPAQIVNLAVSERPILRVAEAYTTIKKNIDFDKVLSGQYPANVRGNRPDFRTLNLQDKEGAQVGYVVKF